jgi:ABC-type nitrate/sulfonate/bicarbonate transport system substrate-binding protein
MFLQRTQMDRRKALQLFGFAGGAVLLGGVAACGRGEGGGNGAGSSASAGPLSYKGEVAVPYLEPNISATAFLLASELGFYEEAGLELELVSFPGGTDTVRGVASMGLGMPATLSALTAYQKGQSDLRLVAGSDNRSRVVFLVPVDSDIESLDDLKGRRITTSQPGSITVYLANRIAAKAGLVPGKDLEIINTGGVPDSWTAVQQGLADVAWSLPPASEVLIRNGEARLLVDSNDFVDNWTDATHWATTSFIEQEPEVLQAFLRAQQKAIDTIANDLETAVAAYAKRVDVPEDLARSTLQLASDGLSLQIDRAAIEAVAAAGAELGQLDLGALDLDALIVSDFVDNL